MEAKKKCLHEHTWCKFGLIINTTEMYNLKQVCLTLILIHGHMDARSESLLRQLSPKVVKHIWVEFCMLLILVTVLCYILSGHLQGCNKGDFQNKQTEKRKIIITLACIYTFTHLCLSDLL